MTKRPRLSAHLRLADPPEPAAADAPEGPGPEPREDARTVPPHKPQEDLLRILADAGAEMAHLGWLGWSKGWEVHLRLTRYWLDFDRRR